MVVVTHFPSPYQVELFDEIERQQPGRLEVMYLHRQSALRRWSQSSMHHRSRFLDLRWENLPEASEICAKAGVVIFNFYDDPRAVWLLKQRAQTHKPWCFWGERPGYINLRLGRLRRLWMLGALHRCRAPIWGIGRMAVNGYREEFGAHRPYVNLPYFSNLDRFREIGRQRMDAGAQGKERVILYSGALIHRKGVDMLARSFNRVAAEVPQGRLLVMGAGKWESAMRRKLTGCQDRVEFVGFRDWDSLPQVYARADVLCVPSRHDGWGLVVPEGLAAALPVISTTTTGAAMEFVETGVNGWLLSPGDEAGLHLAMREALTLPAGQLAAMSSAAMASVQNHRLAMGAARFLAAAEEAVVDW